MADPRWQSLAGRIELAAESLARRPAWLKIAMGDEPMSGELKTAAFGDTRNPRQLLIDALEKVENADVAVLVWRDAEGYVQTGWSDGALTERVGLMEFAKLQMVEAGRDE